MMSEKPIVYIAVIMIAAVLVAGLPFTGLVDQRLIGGIQLGVLLAWAATLVIPLVIGLNELVRERGVS
jgi:hypothetical protein